MQKKIEKLSFYVATFWREISVIFIPSLNITLTRNRFRENTSFMNILWIGIKIRILFQKKKSSNPLGNKEQFRPTENHRKEKCT